MWGEKNELNMTGRSLLFFFSTSKYMEINIFWVGQSLWKIPRTIMPFFKSSLEDIFTDF